MSDFDTEKVHKLMDEVFVKVSDIYLQFGEDIRDQFDDPYAHIYATMRGMSTVFERIDQDMREAIVEKTGVDFVAIFEQKIKEQMDVNGMKPQ